MNIGWRFWIDKGGTFTDFVVIDPNNKLITFKLLSHNPQKYKDSIIEGINQTLLNHKNKIKEQSISLQILV